MNNPKLIEIKKLKKYFIIGKEKKELKAVDEIDLVIYQGETLGLVGESGCGKSTLGRTITKLYKADSGNILYQDVDITNLSKKDYKVYQKKMQIIFQDPYSSLNPNMNVYQIIEEPIRIHNKNISNTEVKVIVEDVLAKVGLDLEALYKFPHEFSGGQRQRIGIARALSVQPDFILCDEPISALDVSIQAQVVNTLKDIQKATNVTYLFVAHDLSMVKYICDRIAVMYLGKILEIGNSDDLYNNPMHPYTKLLISSTPTIDKQLDLDNIEVKGDIPSPIDLPTGCRFQNRCPEAFDLCFKEEPSLDEKDNKRLVACHLYQ